MSESSSNELERRIGVFTTDLDLVVRSWDPALELMTGIAAGEACGRRLEELVPDLAERISPELFREPLVSGSAQVLAPALHKYLIPCAPIPPSTEFDRMQQRVVIGALRNDDGALGLVVTVEDVTARLETERRVARQLREGSAAERVVAIRELATFEPTEGVGPIGSALADDDWQVRGAAVRALAHRRDAALVDTVINALRDGHRNFSVLSSALQLLSLTGVDVTDALVSLMGYDDADLRTQAALALGTQRRPEAVEALIAAFDDPDVNVRFHAIEAIGRHGHAAATDRLIAIATSGDFFLAFPAIEALARIGDPIAAPRLSPLLDDPMLAGTVAEVLGRIGAEDAVEALARALALAHTPVDAIVSALAQIHQRYRQLFGSAAVIEDIVRQTISAEATARVLDALPHLSGEALRHAVIVLSWIPDPLIPPALATLLGSADVRHEVVEALVRFGGPAADLLIAHLAAGDAGTKRAAVVALGRMGEARATPALIALLGDDDERDVWGVVMAALARLGDRRAFAPLLERLGDSDTAVRQGAIGALNSIGDPSMCERILPMLDDPSPFVRESAVRVAGYFGYADCVDKVLACCQDPEESVRAAALEHLPYFDDDRALPALTAALTHDEPRARAAAARALGAVYESAALKLLAQALNDADSWVRYFARHGPRPARRSGVAGRAHRARTRRRGGPCRGCRGRRHCCGRQRQRRRRSGRDEPAGRRPRPRSRARTGPHSQRCRRRTPAGRASSGRPAAPADGDRGADWQRIRRRRRSPGLDGERGCRCRCHRRGCRGARSDCEPGCPRAGGRGPRARRDASRPGAPRRWPERSRAACRACDTRAREGPGL